MASQRVMNDDLGTCAETGTEKLLSAKYSRRPSMHMVRRASNVLSKKFSLAISTEDLHCVDDDGKGKINGPYTHLRKIILSASDRYKNYTKERQWLQDAIIEDFLDNVEDPNMCITPSEPWLIFTVGARGAGKIHTIHHLVNTGRLPILSFVQVDPDSIRRRLPEFQTYDKQVVNDLTRKESSFVAQLLLLAAVQNGRNVVFDSSMRDYAWFLKLIEKIKALCFSSFNFTVLHISAPTELIFERIKKKAQETGREIKKESILSSLAEIPGSLEAIRPQVDFFCEIENGFSYSLKSMVDWDEFERTFTQTCAWKPGMRGEQRMENITYTPKETDDINSFSLRKAKQFRSPFSVLLSSEENNKSDDINFYGKFSHIRRTLDYSFHSHYTFERQKLHDSIITDMLNEAYVCDEDGNIGTVAADPWIVFTAGAMGAGKSHTMRVLVEQERFPLPAFVIVDPDEIRRLLPEYHMYIAENAALAGALTRKEAGYIAEVLTLAALQCGKNVLQDGSLRDHSWYKSHFRKLKEDFPQFRQAIIHITAPRQSILDRAAQRATKTGRIVPSEILEKAIEQVPKSVKILAPMVDYYAEINNAPDVHDIELVKPEGSNWSEFRQQWIQYVLLSKL
mmetsp:Transcript_21136/g.44426  ORF Transcript_21136/g.44426 Transcript_21136/m.44426 type:complete len:623 (-) Transcript_21136:864-2732(-)